jgi:ferritin-like protein
MADGPLFKSVVDEVAEVLSATADEWISNYYRAAEILAERGLLRKVETSE